MDYTQQFLKLVVTYHHEFIGSHLVLINIKTFKLTFLTSNITIRVHLKTVWKLILVAQKEVRFLIN